MIASLKILVLQYVNLLFSASILICNYVHTYICSYRATYYCADNMYLTHDKIVFNGVLEAVTDYDMLGSTGKMVFYVHGS